MRILLVHNFYQQPGEDAVVKLEMALLQDRGHDVSLFSTHNDDIAGFWSKSATALLTIYNPWAKRRLLKVISEFKPDIVHIHNFFPQLSPSVFYACRAADVPCVMTLHNFRIMCPTSFLYHDAQLRERSLTKSAFWAVRRRTFHNSYVGTFFVALMVDWHKWIGTWTSKVDRFIALTEFAKTKFVEGGIPPDLMVVKGNCLASLPTTRDNVERYGALFVGRLSAEKGIEVLLDAWKGLDYPLRIAGDGPLSHLCQTVENKNVTYLGRLDREKVYTEMTRAAFLVLPSAWYEMFPVTVLESFSNGLPVIASKLGGLSEIIENSITGLTFSPVAASALREVVLWAISHEEEMLKMGRHAQANSQTSWTPDVNYSKLLAVYEDTIQSHRRAN